MCPSSGILRVNTIESRTFRKLDKFSCWCEGRDTPSLLGPLVDISFLLSEDETGPIPEKFFSSYLEFRTMDKVQKPNDYEYYTPSSEPFRFYFKINLKQYVNLRQICPRGYAVKTYVEMEV
jgi:hypothetical protein